MDTPATESSALDTNQAAALLANILDPQAEPEKKENEEPPKAEPEKVEPEVTEAEPEAEKVEEATAEPEKVTIEVDGKTVELTKAELAEHYKNGLRQADYTKKTMEAAEQRKAAEAETAKAREERTKYAQGLQQASALLQAQLTEQSQIDWQKLLETDPVEYLKQQHLAQQRQARLQAIQNEQQQIATKFQQEQAAQMQAFLRQQQDDLLAKLPEWKDEAKSKAGKAELVDWLQKNEYPPELLQIVDRSSHLIVGLRKAMEYDKMMTKASAAAKKVENLPQKVERPGGGEKSAGLDRRASSFQRLSKSGKVEDAAAVFSQIL